MKVVAQVIAQKISRLLEIQSTLAPPYKAVLNPPATIEEVRNAERELNVELPSELVELLLFANGQPYLKETISPIFPGVRFADIGWRGQASYGWLSSIDEIVERVNWARQEYEEYGESPDEPFELTGPVCYHNSFIDFTASENSDNLVIDLMPAAGGSIGQVVMMSTQPCHLGVLAPSISDFLDLVIEGFLNGRFLPCSDEECQPWWDGGW